MGDMMSNLALFQQAQAAQQQQNTGADWLSFAKDQFGVSTDRQKSIDALTSKVAGSQLAAQDQATTWAGEDRTRYKSVFQPLQDQFISKAQNWDSADAQAKAAAEAKADVANNFATQDAQRTRSMSAMGVDPNSGRYAGVERAADTEAALAGAGAQNNARSQLRQQALSLQGSAINMGATLPGQADTNLALGVQSGTSAETGTIAANTARNQGVALVNAGYEGAMAGYKGAASTYGNMYQSLVSQQQAEQQQQNQTFGSIAGGVGTLVGTFGPSLIKSDENAKEDKREVRGILDALKKMPVEAWKYKEGQGDGGEHVGTYAQDFKKATGLGDGKSINVIDALGVTMGAVKELAEKVEGLKGRADGDETSKVRSSARRPIARSIFRQAA